MKKLSFTIALFLFTVLSYLPVQAQETYVYDYADLLTSEEEADLNQEAQRLTDLYDCGIYILTIDDYNELSPGVTQAAEVFYNSMALGAGEERNGTLLMLSMEERDYAIVSYGDQAHAAFTDYGKEWMADQFLDAFGEDDWYGGFLDYLSAAEEMMAMESSGTPLDVDTDPDKVQERNTFNTISLFVIPLIVSAGIMVYLCSKMRSARLGTEASEYIVPGSEHMLERYDIYTHTTVTRHKIPKNESSGGTSINSGGFSSHSGKF